MEYRKYANRLYIFLIVIMMLAGCSSDEDNHDDTVTEITDEQENMDNDSGVGSDTGNDSSKEDAWTQHEYITYGGVITVDTSPATKGNKKKDENAEELEDKAEEILEDNLWGIELGRYSGQGFFAQSETWSIYKKGFSPKRDRERTLWGSEWMENAAGCIEFVQEKIEYYYGNGCPQINTHCCEGQYNMEQTESGWLCEVKMLLYKDVSLEYRYYWCIIDIDDENNSKWLYLNQEAFTKEEALAIAEYLRER